MREIDELRGAINDELADQPPASAPAAGSAEHRRGAQTALLAASGEETPAYDSARRRAKLAAQLRDRGVPLDAVEAVVLADTAQALPPEMAASAAAGHTTAQRPAAARRTSQRQRKRGR